MTEKLTHRDGFDRTAIIETLDAFRRMPLELTLNSFAVIDGHTRYIIPPHLHREYEVMIPLRENYVSTLNGREIAVVPGAALLVQPGDRHEEACRGSFRFAGIRFSFTDLLGRPWSCPLLRPELPPEERILPLGADSLLQRLLGIMLSDVEPSPVRRSTVNILAQAFVWELLAGVPPARVSRELPEALENNRFLRRLEALFAEHQHGPLPPEQMAKTLGMSRRALEYRLGAMLGISPARAFLNYRIRNACTLLRNGCSVKETSDRLGFPNPFHFSRVFRRVTGRPPSEFTA